jgi:hypothetical protein
MECFSLDDRGTDVEPVDVAPRHHDPTMHRRSGDSS